MRLDRVLIYYNTDIAQSLLDAQWYCTARNIYPRLMGFNLGTINKVFSVTDCNTPATISCQSAGIDNGKSFLAAIDDYCQRWGIDCVIGSTNTPYHSNGMVSAPYSVLPGFAGAANWLRTNFTQSNFWTYANANVVTYVELTPYAIAYANYPDKMLYRTTAWRPGNSIEKDTDGTLLANVNPLKLLPNGRLGCPQMLDEEGFALADKTLQAGVGSALSVLQYAVTQALLAESENPASKLHIGSTSLTYFYDLRYNSNAQQYFDAFNLKRVDYSDVTGATPLSESPFFSVCSGIPQNLFQQKWARGGTLYNWGSASGLYAAQAMTWGTSMAIGCGGEPSSNGIALGDSCCIYLLSGLSGALAHFYAPSYSLQQPFSSSVMGDPLYRPHASIQYPNYSLLRQGSNHLAGF